MLCNFRPSLTLIESSAALSFFKFSDPDPVQIDLISNHWIIDPSRKELNSKIFLDASEYFDREIQVEGETTDYFSIEDLLHIYDVEGQEGPKLEIPSYTLKDIDGVTVELWVAFDKFTVRNFSLVGVSDRSWIEGFGLAGTMNNAGASINCIMNDYEISDVIRNPCPIENKACASLREVTTWYHLACLRDGSSSRIMVNKEEPIKELLNNAPKAVSKLFDGPTLTLGAKYNGKEIELGFDGYIRELRIWSKALDKTTIRSMLYTSLQPLEHSSLIGYWPLVGGKMNTFVDISKHFVKEITNDKIDTTYARSSHEWTRNQDLWTLPICRKGFVYHFQSKSCIIHRKHLAIYNSEDTLSFQMENKQFTTGWDSTMSVWVYHTKKVSVHTVIIGIQKYITLNYTDNCDTSTTGSVCRLTAQYGDDPHTSATYLIGTFTRSFIPKLHVWTYYALVTKSDTAELKSTFFYGDNIDEPQSCPKPGSLKQPLVYILGTMVRGYMKEASIWSRPLANEEVSKLKYLYI